MVRNTLMEHDGSLRTQLKEAIFEPKMTRSKLKEVIEKGQIPVSTWLLLNLDLSCDFWSSYFSIRCTESSL